MSANTKNDLAWARLFNKHPILDEIDKHGSYEITAAAINEFREARLMTKFDHYANLPALFKRHRLTIQPNSRGSYLIGHFVSYEKVADDSSVPIIEVPFPSEIETIDPDNLYSEAAALLCAHNTGMIAEILGEGTMLFTVAGRMSTGRFTYLIQDASNGGTHGIQVENAQCEIDGGYEGRSTFALIEAKNYSVDDFLIRQLFYPYRLWKGVTTKRAVPIFMTYSNDVFSFFVYRFGRDEFYNSIELVERRKYQIVPRSISLEDIYGVLERVRIIPEPHDVPFPQANDFNRVMDLLHLLHVNLSLSHEQITLNYAFDARQTHYYTRAAMYLGLVDRKSSQEKGVFYCLTALGRRVMGQKSRLRNLLIIEHILEHKVFNETLRLYFNQSHPPTKEQIISIMRSHLFELNREGETTIPRRAQTVAAWVTWILKLRS